MIVTAINCIQKHKKQIEIRAILILFSFSFFFYSRAILILLFAPSQFSLLRPSFEVLLGYPENTEQENKNISISKAIITQKIQRPINSYYFYRLRVFTKIKVQVHYFSGLLILIMFCLLFFSVHVGWEMLKPNISHNDVSICTCCKDDDPNIN